MWNGAEYEGYKVSCYKNGELIDSSYLNVDHWNLFKNESDKKGANSFFIGVLRNYDSNKKVAFNDYGNMILKNCRFYTRPLSDAEIKLNYDTRLAYDQ